MGEVCVPPRAAPRKDVAVIAADHRRAGGVAVSPHAGTSSHACVRCQGGTNTRKETFHETNKLQSIQTHPNKPGMYE